LAKKFLKGSGVSWGCSSGFDRGQLTRATNSDPVPRQQ
jgi:hypothetical protein